jgi:FHS family L-fucose permease-like MFS transporter
LVSLKVDVLQKFGYKRHYLLVYYFLHLVLLCLFLQQQWSFPFFLTALFTVGLGFSIQQIVANPLLRWEALILVHTA